MYATRVIAGLIAGAVGAVAGGAAVALVAFLLHGAWTLNPFLPASQGRTYYVSVGAFVLVFVSVMAAVFRVLERSGLVREPPASHSPLGLTDRRSESHGGGDAGRRV